MLAVISSNRMVLLHVKVHQFRIEISHLEKQRKFHKIEIRKIKLECYYILCLQLVPSFSLLRILTPIMMIILIKNYDTYENSYSHSFITC